VYTWLHFCAPPISFGSGVHADALWSDSASSDSNDKPPTATVDTATDVSVTMSSPPFSAPASESYEVCLVTIGCSVKTRLHQGNMLQDE